MKIEATHVIVGVGAGIVDTGLAALDERQGWTEPYRNSTEWSRIGLCLIGYLGQGFNFYPRAMAALAQSEVTLVTKSLGDLIRTRLIAPAMVSRPTRRTVTRRTIGGSEMGVTPTGEEVIFSVT